MANAHRAAFTLLEICLALLIGLLIIVLAVPSIAGLLAERRLRESFARFDALVTSARQESIMGQRECRLVWDRQSITLHREGTVPAHQNTGAAGSDRMVFQQGENFSLLRPAALQKNAPEEWTFWSNGTCEPVQIAFLGPTGSWLAKYDPLTGHATFLKSEVR